MIQLMHAFNVRSNTESIIKTGLFSNPVLWGAVILAGFLQVMPVLIRPLNDIFNVAFLSGQQWAIAIGGAFMIVVAVELMKIIMGAAMKWKRG